MSEKSNQLVLYGDITEDLIKRITLCISASVNRYSIQYDKISVTINISKEVSGYHILLEDINSIFASNN